MRSNVSSSSYLVVTVLLFVCLSSWHIGTVFCRSVSMYNVVWTSPSTGSEASMPIGNGRVAANIWMEPGNSKFSLYIARGDARDENTELLKLTKVDILIDPVINWNKFNQTLDLDTATVWITVSGQYSGRTVSLLASVWIDANSDNVFVDLSSPDISFTWTVALRPWRTSRTSQPGSFQSWMCTPSYIYPDVIVDNVQPNFPPDSLVFYHRNIDSGYFTSSLTLQGLGDLINSTANPIVGNQFGGAVYGNGLKRVNSTVLKSSSLRSLRVVLTSLTQQTPSSQVWESNLRSLLLSNPLDPKYRTNHVQFWSSFWDRSHISITSTSEKEANDAFTVSQQYTLWRYVQAIQARTKFPIKFNGMLFVTATTNPDDRDWGGGDWWQNLRLPYYNMLNSGDFDLMNSLFDYYLDMLPLARARTPIYFNTTGAFWPETNVLLGLYYNSDYGCPGNRNGLPPEIPQTRWNRYNYQGGLDLSLLILDHYAYTQDLDHFRKYLPLITATLEFYNGRWKELDKNGKLILFPSQAIETYQCPTYPPIVSDCVTNDLPDIAGMKSVVEKVLALGPNIVGAPVAKLASQLQPKIPDLPMSNDKSHLLAGEKLPPSPGNSENPELYAVHPYRLYTVATNKDNTIAINSYKQRRFKCNQGWCQDLINAALLGITSEAMSQVVERANTAPAPGYRFPSFMPHLQDFPPSADHLSNLNTALQWMLLQPGDDGTIVLFPAWPCGNWNVDFKLLGPKQTTIEATLVGGKLTNLNVTPASRKNDVKIAGCS